MANKLVFLTEDGQVDVGYESLPLMEIADGVSVQALFEFALQAVRELEDLTGNEVKFYVPDFNLVQDEGVVDMSDKKDAIERFMNHFVQFASFEEDYDNTYKWLEERIPESDIVNVCQLIEKAEYTEDKRLVYDEAMKTWELQSMVDTLVDSFMELWAVYGDPHEDYEAIRARVSDLPIKAIFDALNYFNNAEQGDEQQAYDEIWDEWWNTHFLHERDDLESEFLEYLRISEEDVETAFYDKVLLNVFTDDLIMALKDVKESDSVNVQYVRAWRYATEWAEDFDFTFDWSFNDAN